MIPDLERKLIDEAWAGFARAVLPPDAPAVQYKEMRRAFYGGSWAILCMVRGLGAPEVTEAEGVAIMERLVAENVQFCADLKAGKA